MNRRDLFHALASVITEADLTYRGHAIGASDSGDGLAVHIIVDEAHDLGWVACDADSRIVALAHLDTLIDILDEADTADILADELDEPGAEPEAHGYVDQDPIAAYNARRSAFYQAHPRYDDAGTGVESRDTFVITVQVHCETLIQAERVAAERFGYDEDYGFPYQFGPTTVRPLTESE